MHQALDTSLHALNTRCQKKSSRVTALASVSTRQSGGWLQLSSWGAAHASRRLALAAHFSKLPLQGAHLAFNQVTTLITLPHTYEG